MDQNIDFDLCRGLQISKDFKLNLPDFLSFKEASLNSLLIPFSSSDEDSWLASSRIQALDFEFILAQLSLNRVTTFLPSGSIAIG